MLKLISKLLGLNSKWFSSSSLSSEQKLNLILERFFEHPQNQWIKSNTYTYRIINSFFHLLNKKTIDFFYHGFDLIMVPSNGKLSLTFPTSQKVHVIVIFPEPFKLLNSCSPDSALAILAHGLGHIINKHSQRSIGILESQLEADQFAFEMGLGKELAVVLEEYIYLPECLARWERL